MWRRLTASLPIWWVQKRVPPYSLNNILIRYPPPLYSGYENAQQLMDQWRGGKEGQCNGDEAKFNEWILRVFGYWNKLYARVGEERLLYDRCILDDVSVKYNIL